MSSQFLTAVGSLVGILAMIGLAARLWQTKFMHRQATNNRTMVLRETVALDPRRRLHLVQCGERQVVLLVGGAQDIVVGWMSNQ